MSARSFILFVLAFGHAMSHWFQGALSVCLPAIIADLGISYTQIGFVRSLQRGAVLLSSVGGGLATDFLDRRKFILVFSVLWPSFFFFLQGYSSTLGFFAILVFLQNLCGGFLWHAPARATIGEYFPERMGYGLGIHAMGGNVAQTVAPLLVGTLLTFMTWRSAFKLTLVPGLLMALFLFLVLPPLARKCASQQKKKPYLEVLRADIIKNREFLAVCLVASLRAVGETMMPVFLPLYLATELHKDAATIGLYLASLTLVSTAGAPLLGYLSDRWGRTPTISACLFSGGVMIALIPAVGSDPILLPVVAFAGIALFAVGPIIQASGLECTRAEIWGSAQSVMDVARSSLSLTFPLFAGLVADWYGIQYTFYLVGGINLLGACIVVGAPKLHSTGTAFLSLSRS